MSTKIHIVLDDDLAEQVRALAKHEDRAFSRQIAFMLRRALDGTPAPQPEPGPEGRDQGLDALLDPDDEPSPLDEEESLQASDVQASDTEILDWWRTKS